MSTTLELTGTLTPQPAEAASAAKPHPIRRPYRFQGWWCVDLSDGTGKGFEHRGDAVRFYEQNMRRVAS